MMFDMIKEKPTAILVCLISHHMHVPACMCMHQCRYSSHVHIIEQNVESNVNYEVPGSAGSETLRREARLNRQANKHLGPISTPTGKCVRLKAMRSESRHGEHRVQRRGGRWEMTDGQTSLGSART